MGAGVTATPVADAIRAMQDRLGRPEWWCKRMFRHGNAACLVGAMNDVTKAGLADNWPPDSVRNEVFDLLQDAAKGWASNPSLGLPGLNDLVLADHHELLLFLDAALDVAEAEGL